MKTIILGPPGTGKTTTLLNLVDQFIKQGIRPKQIGYFSFTRKAANEAATRAAEKFGLDRETDLENFRTLHSFAFRKLGITKEKMMGPDDYREFGKNVVFQLKQLHFLVMMELLIQTMNILQSLTLRELNEWIF
jgi:superfamily I DNA/RNA helicase